MAEFKSLRRYFLSKRIVNNLERQHAIAGLWQYKQEQEPGGTVFPDSFPSKAELEACGYVASEDLVGADAQELIDFVQLSQRDAEAVLAAHAEL